MIMKKQLIASLLVVVMLATMATAFAEPIEKSNAMVKFLKETDTKTKDIAIEIQSGDKTSDLVFRIDDNNLHLVTRTNGTEDGHLQLNPVGLYLDAEGTVSMIKYTTLINQVNDILNLVDSLIKKVASSVPQSAIDAAAKQAAVATIAAHNQAMADAATMTSVATAFGSKFKPEYVLDVQEEYGSLKISLRPDAFAAALADAMDEMMSNPDFAELVDRQAAVKGGATFAEMQKDWLLNRESILETVRTIQSTDNLDEDGHYKSEFSIGGEAEDALECTMEVWDDEDEGEMTFNLREKDKDPMVSYEMKVNADSLWQKMVTEENEAEIHYGIEDNRITSGKIDFNVKDKDDEYLKAEFGPDYLYIKGPKGGFSTSVRETWTGKTRYELVYEAADADEKTMIVDLYEDGDSLVCEVKPFDSDDTTAVKLSRIDKIEVKDLSTVEGVTEVTQDANLAKLQEVLEKVIPATETATPAEAGK